MIDRARRERVERRVLGALRFVDNPTGLPVDRPLSIEATGVRIVRNHRGDYVLANVPGLAHHSSSFVTPPSEPALGTVPVLLTVADPSGFYLPRRLTVRLPRDPDPGRADQAASVFRPVTVTMFRAPAATTAFGWAVVRASVRRAGANEGIPAALLRVARAGDGALLASGLTDRRGEALVAVPGIPITTWGEDDGAVMATEVDATVEAVVDPAGDGIADPDDLEARRAELPSSSNAVKLASGRVVAQSLTVTLP